jgi:hypothetical protein
MFPQSLDLAKTLSNKLSLIAHNLTILPLFVFFLKFLPVLASFNYKKNRVLHALHVNI